MLIDWFTVFAQVINFLVLIVILKRFLYGPIIKAMDSREKKIAERMQNAEKSRREAENLAAEMKAEKEALTHSRQQLMDQAREEVMQWRDSAMEEARHEVTAQHQAWTDSLSTEQEAFLRRLKYQIGRQAFRLADKVLHELADASLENRLAETFLHNLESKNGKIFGNDDKNAVSLLLQSGFPLQEDQKANIKRVLIQNISHLQHIEFALNPELGFGLRLMAGDRKIEWNLNRYMEEMEENVLRIFKFSTGTST